MQGSQGSAFGKPTQIFEEDIPAHVTESARAHSYYSISTGTQIGVPSAVPFLTPASKSALHTSCSVKRCLIHPTEGSKSVFLHSIERQKVSS